jgi:hypothetical protein
MKWGFLRSDGYLCEMPLNPTADTSLTVLPVKSVGQEDSATAIKSLFQGHELKVESLESKPLEPRNADWFSISLFLLLAWFTWTRVVYHKIVGQLLGAVFNINATNQIVRDENILVQRASIMLSLMYYFAFAMFAFQGMELFEFESNWLGTGFLRFLFILLAVALAYSLKTVLLKVLGNIFEIERPATSYIFNLTLINNATGVILIPIVFLMTYMDEWWAFPLFYLGLSALIISFIYRQIRAFRIWTAMQGVPFFYFILYICTLEISPLLILFKVAKG